MTTTIATSTSPIAPRRGRRRLPSASAAAIAAAAYLVPLCAPLPAPRIRRRPGGWDHTLTTGPACETDAGGASRTRERTIASRGSGTNKGSLRCSRGLVEISSLHRPRLIANSPLRILRGGDAPTARDVGLSADNLLDSIFFGAEGSSVEEDGEEGRDSTADKGSTRTVTHNFQNSVDRDGNNFNSSGNQADAQRQKLHAVWGPNALHRKEPPGPPPARATADERRAHEKLRRERQERRRLLDRLAFDLHDARARTVRDLIRGSCARVPPALFGQTLAQERSACDLMFGSGSSDADYGADVDWHEELRASAPLRDDDADAEDSPPPLDEEGPPFRHVEDSSLLSHWGLTPDAKLYGGAQYHRALRYYHHLFLTAPLPVITDDEIALLVDGISEVHDASDLMRAVALLVRQKMERAMEGILSDMTRRLRYVMDRQWEMAEYAATVSRPLGGSTFRGTTVHGDGPVTRESELLRRHGADYSEAEAQLRDALSEGYRRFVEERATHAYEKSLEDVRTMLRYVAWDVGGVRARGREPGLLPRIEIASRQTADGECPSRDDEGVTKNVSKIRKKRGNEKKNRARGRESVHLGKMTARGGDGAGGGRWWGRLDDDNDATHYEESGEGDLGEEGDLIGGVMNRGVLHVEDNDYNDAKTNLEVAPRSSPTFGADDEALRVLLDTASSALRPSSPARASLTRAAIEGLAAHLSDRTRLDVSRTVRAYFNSHFLLAFHEDLSQYLRRALDKCVAEGS
ncbi:hypothetical protein ACHAWF_009989 [Thalassiosira exigua]